MALTSQTSEVKVEQVLMLVKTYPTPSANYGELVCTAGIRLRDLQWIRIYPYPFRLVSNDYRFKKGDILELPLQKASQDPRPESYKIYDINAIKKVDHFGTENHWEARMKYVQPTLLNGVNELKEQMFPNDKGWGSSIRPIKVNNAGVKFLHEKNPDWTPEQLSKLKKAQDNVYGSLFLDEDVKKHFRILERVPYTFRLIYADSLGASHKHQILDWEIAQLFFNERQRLQNDQAALESVRFKIENQIFAEDREVVLIIGNIHHRYRNPNALAVDGFLYPKRRLQYGLFQ